MMLETPSMQVARAGTVVCTGGTCARLVLGRLSASMRPDAHHVKESGMSRWPVRGITPGKGSPPCPELSDTSLARQTPLSARP